MSTEQYKQYIIELTEQLLLEKKTPNFSNKFMGQKDGAAKTRFVLGLMNDKNILPPPSLIFQPKNNDTSTHFCNVALSFINDGDFSSALECLNNSICLATNDSQELAMGYMNRSTVYLITGFYQFCLQNNDVAVTNNKMEEMKLILEKNRKMCLKVMSKHEDSLEKFNKERDGKMPLKLSYPASEYMPIMIDGLGYATNDQYGHHILAKKDLYPGDIIMIEKPFSKHVDTGSEYTHCANCLDQNYLNLFPCDHCTKAMFCSEDCRQEAWTRFHKYECPIIDGIFNFFEITKPMLTAIRTTLYAFTMFDEPEELQKLIKEINVETESAFDLDYNHLTEQNHFRAIYALATHESDQDFDELFKYATFCTLAWHLLNNYTDLHLLLKTKDMEDFFINTLFRMFQTCKINGKSVGTLDGVDGGSLYALCSLLNHSCAPNVTRLVDGITSVIVVERVIKAGEQVFEDSGLYESNHRYVVKEERQTYLKRQWNFVCQCEACVRDYPLLEELPVSLDFLLTNLIQKQLLEKNINNQDFVSQKFEECKNYLKYNDHRYPYYEFDASADILRKCLCALKFSKPWKLKFEPVH